MPSRSAWTAPPRTTRRPGSRGTRRRGPRGADRHPSAAGARSLALRGHDVVVTFVDAGGRGLISAGGMRPMIVVMVDPDADRFAALALGVESVGVEAFLGEDPLVALDFPVVPGRVRPGPLMPRRMRVHGAHERLRAVVGAVVGDHPDQAIDDVRSEESPGPGEETDGGRGGLVLEGFGVGEAGVAIDCGVQVGVAHALLALLRVA